MRDEVDSELSIEELARAVNLSLSHYHHLFKSETGTSPARYLRTLRLEMARDLLVTSLLNVKQVMNSVGIRDKGHFTREFKKMYGLTPTQYRAAHPLITASKQP